MATVTPQKLVTRLFSKDSVKFSLGFCRVGSLDMVERENEFPLIIVRKDHFKDLPMPDT